MVEVKYIPPVNEIVVEYDEELFRSIVKEYLGQGNFFNVNEYSSFDDWVFDAVVYINEVNDLCRMPWFRDKNDYVSLYELDNYVGSMYSDEIVKKIYDICEKIIKETVKSR